MQRNLGLETRKRFETALKIAGLDHFSILHEGEIRLWMVIRK